MTKRNYRKAILRTLDTMRKHNPMGYAQVLMLPFGPVPSYAIEDDKSEWWESDEARDRLDSLRN